MTAPADPHSTARPIAQRLSRLLVQAFGAVVALIIVILLAVVSAVFVNLDVARIGANFTVGLPLQAYYLGHGSWAGVETLVTNFPRDLPGDTQSEWRRMVLLDQAGRVLIDAGRTDTPLVGQLYPPNAAEPRLILYANGAPIGTLVIITGTSVSAPLRILAGLLVPVAGISFFLGLLTLLIGFQLMQRVVQPLADVIAASQSVAAGDLSARVTVQGPGDLRSLSDSFNRMADALERDDRERRNLLTDVAHELRTPLTVMRGKLEGIVDGVYPATEAHIAPVLEQTYVLERLVEDLRLLTLAETRQLHFEKKTFDLGELAQRTASLFDAEAQERRIALSVTVAPATPAILADPQRVGQVIGNLVSNALRYVPEGGQVAITVQAAAEAVELAVSDNGPGVDAADLPHLFDRFWRGEKSRARAAGGAGLGLAIARQLVEAQGGTLTASLPPGGGLRVALQLKSA